MTGEKIEYAEIIADLESKRATLETAISSLKALMALGTLGLSEGVLPTTAMPFAASGTSGEIPDGSFNGMSLAGSIRLYLELMRKKQTAREISEGLRRSGVESTSKYFDKIVFATLYRLKKAREVVKIGAEWGLPSWYPALMRAGITENDRKPKRRGRPPKAVKKSESGKSSSVGNKPIVEAGHNAAKLSERLSAFLKEHPSEAFTAKQLSEKFGIHPRVISMRMAALVKKGEIHLSAPGGVYSVIHD